ncbi:hypothetical protein PGB90_000618 [Kerria lacca]
MLTNGYVVGDGSWTLIIKVTDFKVERKLRVKGDLHIGGLMLRLVEDLDIAIDWSDHALWWPSRNKWLTRTRSTLDQCGVQADVVLHFTPMHKTLRLQLPDLRYLDCKVDFSIKTFNAVMQLCKELGIRHPEELSLCKPLEPHHLKYNLKDLPPNKKHFSEVNSAVSPDTNTFIFNQSPASSTGSLDRTLTPVKHSSSTPISSPVTPTGTWKRNCYSEINGNVTTLELLNGNLEASLAHSPASLSHEARLKLLKPKSLIEKARMNIAWLDSSLSIMEQGIAEYDTLKLRYKFYSFYDLNSKMDAVRINMIYEQAKWSLLNEELEYTEEEALMFAALQVQINLQASIPQPISDTSSINGMDDDIDAALTDLQVTLEGSYVSSSNEITRVPELYDYLRFLKPKKFTLKAYKRYWFACSDVYLRLYKNQVDGISGTLPIHVINLRGCEVTPDVNLSQNKFGIKLEVPSPEGMSEMWIRCETKEQYAKWMAACRLVAKGRSLSDNTYESEVKSIINFLEMQRPALAPAISPSSLDISSEDYISPKYVKKLKNKAIQKILEAHANVKDLTLTEAKMNYIKAWQSLPDFGITLFVVRFIGQKKDELLGIASNRIMRMDLNSGDHIKTWRYNTMKEWNVNWEIKHMMIEFEEGKVIFACQSADCKVIHEFIGGYIFLSTRSKEANQSLNEELFHKLTGGWV